VWVPSPSPAYVWGEEHGLKPLASRLQANVEAASLLVNVKLALALLLEAGGVDAIAVSGGIVSTVQVYIVTGPVLPIWTLNVCCPSWRPE
jgi:hypothetical protein